MKKNRLNINTTLFFVIIIMVGSFMVGFCQSGGDDLPLRKDAVVTFIEKVNDYYQAENPIHGRAFWDNAAYHTGNMAAYGITGKEQFKDYSMAWAEKNQWKGAKSTNKAQWKHTYGETYEFVLFGDWQICFQTYIDLYNLDSSKDTMKIARAKEVMEYQMGTPYNYYWWWADGLYMVMPVMTKMYKITGNQRYLEKLHEYFMFADSIMFDEEIGLYYRDAKYVYPKHKTSKGKKDFWARGDGWVFAGLAKVLADLPQDNPHRDFFIQRYLRMAKALASSQQPEGYWTRSILDPEYAPGPETSGTAFFTFGLLWGINNGLLKEEEYKPTALKAWAYITSIALQPDGRIGYVQPIGERAIPGQLVDKHSSAGFGVAAVLLAAAEMYKMVD